MVQKAEGTAEKHTSNNADMDMAAGLPSNANDGTLTENLSYCLNEESLKVMGDQRVQLDTTERLNSKVRTPVREILLLGKDVLKLGKEKKGGNLLMKRQKQPKYIVVSYIRIKNNMLDPESS